MQPCPSRKLLLLLHVPLRETVGAMKVLIGVALRVARRETATTALRALCDGATISN